ncbi:cytochrome P450 [Paraburkholderia sp. MMS20-SJTN17]|uniref:Cytochrome P450 n=1 Tax=Paraburkholderia translucens TaxID=2886945 RepID=A0ABS8K7L0_9BURK|nr:cytochrome P450 [Paraburkholderia sp. MMS20-SJTN17]MCC8400493.1 cytochrome P450 [Paraburkholderia sp. MMS20-SJTN17]
MPRTQIVLRLGRTLMPISSFFGRATVLLHDDVEEVLTRNDIFVVPFGVEMARLNGGATESGTPFILGMDNKPAHDNQLRTVMAAFRYSDAECVAKIAARHAQTVIEGSKGRLEAISQLITRIPLQICIEYLGVEIPDRVAFTNAVIVLSGHLFGKPPIERQPLVDDMAAIVRNVVEEAIGKERAYPSGDRTVIGRLVAKGVDADHVRAILMGLIVGFVPTNTLAGGNILEMLLSRQGFFEATRAAALAGDDILLSCCLFEALRFMPINSGPYRRCSVDYTLAEGTLRARRIRKDTWVLACTESAMFDGRKVERPFDFIPGRAASDYMQFGFGMHWCVGAFIARAQLVNTFKPLLLRRDLRRANGPEGQMKRRAGSTFPESLVVQFK